MRRVRVFVPLRGQYDNIGDVILRRELLDWLRFDEVEVHIFVGQSTPSFDEALGLQSVDRRYSSVTKWMLPMLKSGRSRLRDVYLFKPGELQLEFAGMKEHLGLLPGIAAIRARGGRAYRIGAGIRASKRLGLVLLMPSVLMSNRSLWRDPMTTATVNVGETIPDLAFGQGTPAERMDDSVRDVLVVSMRGDRAAPSEAWLSGVAAFAARERLRIVVVTQVLPDAARSSTLAERLNAELVQWNTDSHSAQEKRLRSVYQRTRIAVSDRLHVLIAAATEGATPSAPLELPNIKIGRHFDAIGLPNVASFASAEGDVVHALDHALERTDVRPAVNSARQRLAAERAWLREQIIRMSQEVA